MISQAELAFASVNGTNSLIQQHLKDLRKSVGFFVDNHEAKIKYLAVKPEDHSFHVSFNKLVEKHFADAVTYTLANSEGEVL